MPLNDSLKRVDATASETNLTQARKAFNEQRWANANLVRTLLTLGAVLLTSFALYVS